MTEGTMNKYPSTVTGKTIEQKAEEKGVKYADSLKPSIGKFDGEEGYSWSQVEEGYENGFKDGAEFGYNKGFKEGLKQKQKVNITTISDCPIKDDWHYVKDCLPPKKKLDVGTKSEIVYVATRGYGDYKGYYNFSRKVWYLADDDYQEINEVYAWWELPVPPKEVEE